MNEKELKEQGTVDPRKKPTWLKEVRLDAARNTVEHLRRQKEAQEFERAKARGVTVEELIEKGRDDLELPEPENTGTDTTDSGEPSAEEVAELKAQLKAERAARTRAENKAKKLEENTGTDESEDGSAGSNDEEETK